MSLGTIIGHRAPLRMLRGMVRRDRVPSALLFSGDTGIGKKLTALAYAKVLNCLDPRADDCCDRCISCEKIDRAVHPDVTSIEAVNGEIKIEAVRGIIESLSFRPFEGRMKVVIMDDADALNISAANAFLKTLEEPPAQSLIILISSKPDRLPETVRSRCVRVRFTCLSAVECLRVVESHAGKTPDGMSAARLMGRPGLAGDYMQERERFVRSIRDSARGLPADGWGDREEIAAWCDMLLLCLRDVAVYSITGRREDLLLLDDCRKQDLDKVMRIHKEVELLRGRIALNLNKQITMNYVASLLREVDLR